MATWAEQSENMDDDIGCPAEWLKTAKPLREEHAEEEAAETSEVGHKEEQHAEAKAPTNTVAPWAARQQKQQSEATPAGDFPTLGGGAAPTQKREQQPQQQEPRPRDDEREQRPRDEERRSRYDDRSYGGGRREHREPRESAPIPTSPPYEAHVGNLAFDIIEADLRHFFEDNKCPVSDVRVPMDRETRKARGFGYVVFEDRRGLEDALKLDGMKVRNRPIHISVAERRDDRIGSNRDRDRRRPFSPPRDDRRGPRPSPREEPMPERKPLVLSPRSVDAPVGGAADIPKPKSPRPDPFGGAKPRDEEAAERRRAEFKAEQERKEQERKEQEKKKEPEAAKVPEKEAPAKEAAPAKYVAPQARPGGVKAAAPAPAPAQAAHSKSGRDPSNPWGKKPAPKAEEKKTKKGDSNPFDALGDA